MQWDHVIQHGTIVTPNSIYKANIYMKDGKIAAISETELPGEAKEITDASGLHVLPGLIDTHVHSRDGGATHKEDFFHSTQAAAAGGITTIFEMPNTNPTINNPENFNKQLNNFKEKAHVDFGIWGICLGELNNHELQNLNDAGVIGFKYFWGYGVDKNTFQLVYNVSDDTENILPPCDDGEVYEIFEEVAKTGNIIAIHAENADLINHLSRKIQATGKTDYDTFLSTRGHLPEVLTIHTGIEMAKATGARLHILHVSTAEGVDLIKKAQEEGYPITAETCPHYLFLTNEDYPKIGNAMKIYPLVKHKEDQERIWEGISEGVISFVCSDHAPHTEEEKAQDIWSAPAGACGVETLAPLMLNAVSEEKISLQQVAALLSENPAKQFGIYPQKGAIQIGSDADVTLVDMNKETVINKENLHSKTKVTPYDGFRIKGMPVATIVGGVTVMKDGQIVHGPSGKLVTPSK